MVFDPPWEILACSVEWEICPGHRRELSVGPEDTSSPAQNRRVRAGGMLRVEATGGHVLSWPGGHVLSWPLANPTSGASAVSSVERGGRGGLGGALRA